MVEFLIVLKEKPIVLPDSLEVGCEKRGIKDGNRVVPAYATGRMGLSSVPSERLLEKHT